MAKMYPERPRASMPDSERAVFERLNATLGDSYLVFHSVAWHGRGRKPDGEVDFLVAHPDLGLLVIEVKGGGITIDAAAGSWFSEDRRGEVHEIKDPFAQALAAKHELIAEIRADSRWPGGRAVQIGYAVVFPNVNLGPERPVRVKPEITFERGDMQTLGLRVETCLRYWQEIDRAPRPGHDGIEALARIFGTSTQYRVPLSDLLAEDELRLIELTDQQFRLLDLLNRHRRAAIAGCAGSGKTMLAFEKARRLAESGRRVLLTCFNRNLAGYLRDRLVVPANLEIRHFHGVCSDFVDEVGVVPPVEAGEGEAYIDWLPVGFLDALSLSPRRFDSVVVDEGQDFESEWFDLLDAALKDGVDSQFYVFFDDNQSIYTSEAIPTWLGEPYQLSIDCRNTNQIGGLVRALYRGPELRLSGVEGRDVIYLTYSDNSSPAQIVGRVIEGLGRLRNAGAKPEEIVVLSPRSDGPVWRRRDYSDWRLYSSEEQDGNVFFGTIHAFKGQESRIVVLVELEAAAPTGNKHLATPDELLYVGCSRATTQLVVIAAQAAANRLQALVEGTSSLEREAERRS